MATRKECQREPLNNFPFGLGTAMVPVVFEQKSSLLSCRLTSLHVLVRLQCRLAECSARRRHLRPRP